MPILSPSDNPFVSERSVARGAQACYAVLSLAELEALATLAREKIAAVRGSADRDACVILYSLAAPIGESLQVSSSSLALRVAGAGRSETFAVPSGRRV